jgi:hypothetical protein
MPLSSALTSRAFATAAGVLGASLTLAFVSACSGGPDTAQASSEAVTADHKHPDAGSAGKNLLTNGDFASGSLAGWKVVAGHASFVAGPSADGSVGSARIGDPTNAFDGLSILAQNVTIPRTGTTTLSYAVKSSCTGDLDHDYFRARILTPAGKVLETIEQYCIATSGFAQPHLADLAGYAGQTVQIRFEARGDGNPANTAEVYVSAVSVVNDGSDAGTPVAPSNGCVVTLSGATTSAPFPYEYGSVLDESNWPPDTRSTYSYTCGGVFFEFGPITGPGTYANNPGTGGVALDGVFYEDADCTLTVDDDPFASSLLMVGTYSCVGNTDGGFAVNGVVTATGSFNATIAPDNGGE